MRISRRRSCSGKGVIKRCILFSCLAGLLIAGGAMNAVAGEGRTPVNGVTTIVHPGSYYLTEDITGTSGDIITISADHVTLDMMGHTISGAVTAGVRVTTGHTDITIRDGRIMGLPQYGVYFHTTAEAVIRIINVRMRVDDTGIEISGDGGTGVCSGTARTQATITDNVIRTEHPTSGIGKGIHLRCVEASRIEHNGISRKDNGLGNPGTNEIGIHLDHSNRNEIGGNNIGENFYSGINLSNSDRNNLRENGFQGAGYGIYMAQSNDNIIERNVASGLGVGLQVGGTGNTIRDNAVTSNAGTGIKLSGGNNHVVGNDISNNSGGLMDHGLYLYYADGNLIADNTISGNGQNGVQVQRSNFNKIVRNTVSGNGTNGIYILDQSKDNEIDWNHMTGNAQYGLAFASTTSGNVYSFNRAKGNGTGGYNDATCTPTCLNDNFDSSLPNTNNQ